MRTLLLFDQVQAGYGGKERGDTELGLEKGGVGSYLMFKEDFEKQDSQRLRRFIVVRIISKRIKKK